MPIFLHLPHVFFFFFTFLLSIWVITYFGWLLSTEEVANSGTQE